MHTLAISLWSLLAALVPADSLPVSTPPAAPSPPTPLLDPDSNPHSLLYREFVDSGWTAFQASVHAHRALGHDIELSADQQAQLAEPPAPDRTTPLLDPSSSAHSILFRAFKESGWSATDASRHANHVLGLDPPDYCYVSSIAIIYCDDGGVSKRKTGYINGHCWNTEPPGGGSTLGECIQDFEQCIGENQIGWMKLKISNDCLGFPNGTCVYVDIRAPELILCPPGDILSCNCFAELSPMDCTAIETLCCSKTGAGPCLENGCPSGCN